MLKTLSSAVLSTALRGAAVAVAAVLLASPPAAPAADKAPPDVTLTGHTSPVLAVAFAPDGKRLASVADDGKLKVWDLTAKKELGSVEGAKSNRNQVRITPDGRTVVCLGSDANVLVVDAATGKPRKPIALANAAGGAVALDLSPDGKTVAVSGRSAVRLFDLATGVPKATHEVHKGYEATGVAYSPDGTKLATVGSDRTALVFDAATGAVAHTFDLKNKGVLVAFAPDGKTLYVYVDDRQVRSIDVATGRSKVLFDRGVVVTTLGVTADGKSLVLAGTGRVPGLLDPADGTVADLPIDSEDRTMAACASPDGKWLAGGGNEGGVFLWKSGR
jgi:WD40 repeat protein